MRPMRSSLERARAHYDMGPDREWMADLAITLARGTHLAPAIARDRVTEEKATREWFNSRQGGWSPIDIVLRSTLYETETWFDPRGQAGSGLPLQADYGEVERRILAQNPSADTGSFDEMYGTREAPRPKARHDLVSAAFELNRVLGLQPPIDLSLYARELRGALREANKLIHQTDIISSETITVLAGL